MCDTTPSGAQRTFIARKAHFSAGRVLGREDWNWEQNQAAYAREAFPHGNNYEVTVFYRGEPDPVDGMIVNLTDLKPALAQSIEHLQDAYLRHGCFPFEEKVPTAENVAAFIYSRLPEVAGHGELARLRVNESRRVTVELTPIGMKVTHRYEFAAAHRLFTPELSGAENWERFDKCSNPAGHGHNYTLEVTVQGAPDPVTGYVVAPVLLDSIVNEEIYARFDHKHLNEDCPEFEHLVPTSENLARVIFQILQARLERDGMTLVRIGLHETQKNYFEVEA